MSLGLWYITIVQVLIVCILIFALIVTNKRNKDVKRKQGIKYMYLTWLSFQSIFLVGWLVYLCQLLEK